MAENEEARSPEVAPMTTSMLKAFAHPLRQRLLQQIERHRYLRAADAAAELGEPANKISFHLRVLADAGLIEEAPEKARDRRDRVWTATKGSFSLGSAQHPLADETLGTAAFRIFIAEHNELVRRFTAWAPEYATGRDATPRGTFTRSTAHLTSGEFEKLMKVIHQAIHDAEQNHDADAEGSRFFEIDIVAADDTI